MPCDWKFLSLPHLLATSQQSAEITQPNQTAFGGEAAADTKNNGKNIGTQLSLLVKVTLDCRPRTRLNPGPGGAALVLSAPMWPAELVSVPPPQQVA